VDWLPCHDFSKISKEDGQTILCSYWKPGLKEGRERAFYPGVFHDLFKTTNPDQTEQYIVAVNSPAFISTEGFHYASLLDVNGPPCTRHGEDRQVAVAFQKRWSTEDPNNR
jgi:hypothetical protein